MINVIIHMDIITSIKQTEPVRDRLIENAECRIKCKVKNVKCKVLDILGELKIDFKITELVVK